MQSPILRFVALAAALAATSCAPPSLSATPTEAPKQLKLTFSTLSWPVHFEPGSAALAKDEQRTLANFLLTVKTGAGDQVSVDAARQYYWQDASLATQRQASIDAVLASLQMSPCSVVPAGVPSSEPALGCVVVVLNVGRYIVTGPSCPDWTKTTAGDFSNTNTSNFGCATMTNLGMMVANPADLARGAKLGNADGDYAAAGVAAYHAGTIDKGVSFASDLGN